MENVHVELTYEEHIAIMTLQRESALNALNTEFLNEINENLDIVEKKSEYLCADSHRNKKIVYRRSRY